MHDHGDVDWAAMAEFLELEAEAHAPYVRQVVAALADRRPRRILDVGAGPGGAACEFAAGFPAAEVLAVDGAPELLTRAEQHAAERGVSIRSRVAHFPDGLAQLPHADMVWTARTVHHVGDQQEALRLLAGLLNPGGVLAVSEDGLPTRFLPRDIGIGRAGLQTRLDVAASERFNQMRTELPDAVPVAEDWPSMLRSAGLTEVSGRTFLVEHQAPLEDRLRQFARRRFERDREAFAEVLDAEDRHTLDRLLDPQDPASIDRRADVFMLGAKTVYFGTR